jgi:hypothetical protein
MYAVMLALVLAVPAAAQTLTPDQVGTITACYQTDAVRRGLDTQKQVVEVLEILLTSTRTQQKNKLNTVMTRCDTELTTQQTTWETTTAAEKAELDATAADVDNAISAIGTMP